MQRALLGVAAGFLLALASCHSARKAARGLVSERGVAVSGESLLAALEGGDGELADALLDLNPSLDILDSSKRTPLMLAAGGFAPFLVSRILEAGVDVEARDAAGRTALVYAVEVGNLKAVMTLLESGASPTVPVPSGGSLVALALRQGRLASVYLASARRCESAIARLGERNAGPDRDREKASSEHLTSTDDSSCGMLLDAGFG